MNIFEKIKMWIAKLLTKIGIFKSIALVKEIDGRQVKIYLDNSNTIRILKKDWELLVSTDEGKELRDYIRNNENVKLDLREGDDIDG